MTTADQPLSWFGAGWLAHHSSHSAWSFLLAAAIGGFLIIAVSYGFTLTAVSPFRRIALCLVRLCMWLALLAILAAPTRIERTFGHPPPPRPLAVLVDRSDSMTTPDNRGHRRLDDALQTWHRIQPAALKKFGGIKSFAFAQGFAATAAATDAAPIPGRTTELFTSLQAALKHAPAGGWGALVTLTDGIDTSKADASEGERAVLRSALGANTPLYFIVGRNRAVSPSYFHLRDFTAPTRTLPHSVIQLRAAFESYQQKESTLPVRLIVDGEPQAADSLRLEAGSHLESWSAEVRADAPHPLEIELRVGGQVARAEVQMQGPRSRSNRVLYYEGALDWGYRFLSEILRRGDTFTVTPVFDFPRFNLPLPAGALRSPPFTADGLAQFGVVILANVSAGQIPLAGQLALTQWVENGGVVVFLTPDEDSTRGFSGSELEKMLPVVFTPSGPDQPAAQPVPVDIGGPARDVVAARPVELIPFTWESPLVVRQILSPGSDEQLASETPRFSAYARVERAKPGAQVLARYPGDPGPDGQGAILLALQNYGRGKSVVFTTDALWRWKLGESSEARGIELFWESLFSWLTRNHQAGIRFDHPPVRSLLNHDVVVRVDEAEKTPLSAEATLGDRHVDLTALPNDGATRVFTWRPAAAGRWEIEATSAAGDSIRAWVSVDKTQVAGELSGAAPDEALLRALAAQSAGDLLEDVPVAWRAKPPPDQLLHEHREPLWQRPIVFAVLLALYGLEMILRRAWKLL